MAKSFRKFRENYDSEWDDTEEYQKNEKMKNRREQRRKKISEKYAPFNGNQEEDDY